MVAGFAVVLVLAVVGAAPAAESGAADEPLVIRLKWMHQYQFAGYYLALERGYFAEEGVAVELRASNPGDVRGSEALRSGEADYVVGNCSMMIDHLNGDPVVLVAQIFQVSPIAIFARSDSGIIGPADLAGARMMMSGDETTNASLVALIRRHVDNFDSIEFVAPSYDPEDLVRGDIDAMTGYLTDMPHLLRSRGLDFTIIDPAAHGIDLYGDALYTTTAEARDHPERVRAIRRAVLRGWRDALDDPEAAIRLIQRDYDRGLGAEQLRFEARMTRRVIMPELVPLGQINRHRYHRIAEFYAEHGFVEDTELAAEYLALAGNDDHDRSRPPSPGERAWLAEHPVVRVAVTGDWAPVEFVSGGRARGLSIDLLSEISEVLPVEFDLVVVDDWSEAVDMLERHEVDLLPAMAGTGQRRQAVTFTSPHTSLPVAIYARNSVGYVDDFASVLDRRVGALAGSAIHEFVLGDDPDADLVAYRDSRSGLRALAAGEVDYFLATLPIGNGVIASEGLSSITVAGISPYQLDLAMGVRRDWPELRRLLDYGLAAIPSDRRQLIRDSWMSYQPPRPPLDLSWLWWLAIPVIGVLSMFLLKNRRLARDLSGRAADLQRSNAELTAQMRLRAEAQDAHQRLGDLLERVLEAQPSALIAVNAAGRVRYHNGAASVRDPDLTSGRLAVEVIHGHRDLARALTSALDERRIWEGRRRMVGERAERLAVYPLAESGALVRIEDLSDQVRLESELHQARKMEGVGQWPVGSLTTSTISCRSSIVRWLCSKWSGAMVNARPTSSPGSATPVDGRRVSPRVCLTSPSRVRHRWLRWWSTSS